MHDFRDCLAEIPTPTAPFEMAATAHTRRWARAHQLVTGERAARRFDRIDTGRFAGLCFPARDAVDAGLLADWTSWFCVFDDHVDEHGIDLAYEALPERLARLHGVLTGEATPASPIAVSLADLWQRTAPRMPPHWRQRFVAHFADYFQGTVWEARLRIENRIPSRAEYVPGRRSCVGMRPFTDLLEVALRRALPAAFTDTFYYDSMELDITDVGSWTNDLYTEPKERSHGGICNLVFVVEAERACARREAVDEVRAMLGESAAGFLDYRRRLPEFLAAAGLGDAAANVVCWADAAARLLRGNMEWAHGTARYHEIERTIPTRSPSYLENALSEIR